jgi:6-methylsalicylate decarboxylase
VIAGCPCCLSPRATARAPLARSRKAPARRKARGNDSGRIDVHHHFLTPDYLAAAGPLYDSPGTNSLRSQWTPQVSLDSMDEGGVRTSIVSLSSPGVWFGEPALRRRLARECNEYAARMAADHPGRFGFFAALPLPDIDASLAEIEYSFDTLHSDGVGLLTNLDGRYLGDPVFRPVLDELERRKAVVYTHPTPLEATRNLQPGIPASAIEFGTDTTRTIASLVFTGTAARTPNVRYIFSHAGGTLPFLVERFTRLARRPGVPPLPRPVLFELRRFYYEVAQAANRVALASLAELVPASRMLFGTDFPYRTAREMADGLKKCDFTPTERSAIDRGNAAKLFPRFKGA